MRSFEFFTNCSALLTVRHCCQEVDSYIGRGKSQHCVYIECVYDILPMGLLVYKKQCVPACMLQGSVCPVYTAYSILRCTDTCKKKCKLPDCHKQRHGSGVAQC